MSLKKSKISIRFLKYDKYNNLLFKVRDCKALYIIDFDREIVRLVKGFATKSIKRSLRKYLYEHYDLNFV